MPEYLAHGLRVASEVALPELSESDAACTDVTIRLGRVRPWPALDAVDQFAVRADAGEVCYFKPGIGGCAVREGREIVVDPAEGVDPRALRLVLLGPALGLLLHQRGRLVLHASAVSTPAGAVALCGDHGRGKSTLATALARRGHPLLADDLCSVEWIDGEPVIHPGHTQVKLWPDSAECVATGNAASLLHPDFAKLGVRADAGFSHAPRVLEHLFVLSGSEGIAVDAIGPAAAWHSITEQWYGARFASALLDAAGAKRLFTEAARLAKRVRVRRLSRSSDLADLDRLTCCVLDDIARVA